MATTDEPHTLTTRHVRGAYVAADWELFGTDSTTVSSDMNAAREAFDRWLAGVIAQAKAEQREADARIVKELARERMKAEQSGSSGWFVAQNLSVGIPSAILTSAVSHPEPTEEANRG